SGCSQICAAHWFDTECLTESHTGKLSNRLQRADSLRFQSRFAGIMKPPRRRFLHLVAGAVALPGVAHFAWAQTYPTRPVRIIVPYPPGGAPDIVARLMGQWISDRLGQQFIIENRPGAGGNIGTEAAVRASSDGYTLLYVVTANAISPALFDKLNFSFIRDIAPVAGVLPGPNLVSVTPSLPVETIPELIAFANQSGKTELRCANRRHDSSRGRIVQDDDRRQHRSCAIWRRRGPGDHRSADWSNAGQFRHH